jgi:hypothetical protein
MISYYGTINVGGDGSGRPGESYKTLFDSGSQDVFLFDEKCISVDCAPHKKYKPG